MFNLRREVIVLLAAALTVLTVAVGSIGVMNPVQASPSPTPIPVDIGTACVLWADGTSEGCE